MLTRHLDNCEEIIAGDNTILRELFNPAKGEDLPFRYSIAHTIVKTGETSTPHKLKTSELYYIYEGEGTMFIDNESQDVHAGHAISIPPHAKQYIKNTGVGDLQFLAIVDPGWRPEDEEIV